MFGIGIGLAVFVILFTLGEIAKRVGVEKINFALLMPFFIMISAVVGFFCEAGLRSVTEKKD